MVFGEKPKFSYFQGKYTGFEMLGLGHLFFCFGLGWMGFTGKNQQDGLGLDLASRSLMFPLCSTNAWMVEGWMDE